MINDELVVISEKTRKQIEALIKTNMSKTRSTAITKHFESMFNLFNIAVMGIIANAGANRGNIAETTVSGKYLYQEFANIEGIHLGNALRNLSTNNYLMRDSKSTAAYYKLGDMLKDEIVAILENNKKSNEMFDAKMGGTAKKRKLEFQTHNGRYYKFFKIADPSPVFFKDAPPIDYWDSDIFKEYLQEIFNIKEITPKYRFCRFSAYKIILKNCVLNNVNEVAKNKIANELKKIYLENNFSPKSESHIVRFTPFITFVNDCYVVNQELFAAIKRQERIFNKGKSRMMLLTLTSLVVEYMSIKNLHNQKEIKAEIADYIDMLELTHPGKEIEVANYFKYECKELHDYFFGHEQDDMIDEEVSSFVRSTSFSFKKLSSFIKKWVLWFYFAKRSGAILLE